MEENTEGNATQYEIIDVRTGVVEPVSKLGSGDVDGDQDADFITHKADGTEVVFKREGQDEQGNAKFVNPGYLVREVGTNLAPNGVDVVTDEVIAEAKAAAEAGDSGSGVGAVTE